MGPHLAATSVPKPLLIGKLLEIAEEQQIRAYFGIGGLTSLDRRLSDFAKSELLTFLFSLPEGETHLKTLEESYPLYSPRTFYFPKIQHRPELGELAETVAKLASLGRSGGVDFGENKAVRVVYVAGLTEILAFQNQALEIPLYYERRVEYGVSDPEKEDYTERKALYSLERAYIWVVDGHSHVIVCCSGMSPVRAIVKFASEKLTMRLWLPNLTTEMFQRISAGGIPRTATFRGANFTSVSGLDVQSITLSDSKLADSKIFREMTQDPNSQQAAGYYSSHPALIFGGLGVAIRYGRAWTPRHLSKESLVPAVIELVQRTEQELTVEFETHLQGYVQYHANATVAIGEKIVLTP